MTRKIIFIIIGALLFLALLGILWFWLLHRSPAADTGTPSGFGTSTDSAAGSNSQNGDGSNQDTGIAGGDNGQAGTGGDNTGIGGVDITGGGLGAGSSGRGGVGTGGGTVSTAGSAIDTGVSNGTQGNSDSQTGSATSSRTTTTTGINSGAWIGSNVSTREFTPAQINDINGTQGIGGTPVISTTPQSASLGTAGIIIGAAAAGCLAQYLIYEGKSAVETATTDKAKSLALGGPYVVVADFNAGAKQNNTKFKTVEECLVKTIARAAIDQITKSVVQWINSGFNGQPSFVTNFNQYFANVADQAAGEFIKGSALSFLCSPFAPQIKLAIAQSYANRNNAATCSLTKIINNTNSFIGSGGWGGMLRLTTVPTNNPYGAYAYAQVGLNSSISSAQNNANRNVSPGGFISLQRKSCIEVPSGSKPATPSGGSVTANGSQNGMTNYTVCQNVVTTPGEIIEASLKQSVVKSPIDGLNLAQNINDIIVALTNQVMIKTLYGGLGSANSITNPLAPAIDQGASAQAQALLSQLQGYLTLAGQYASVEQGSIQDVQNAQANLNNAFNCWSTIASSTGGGGDQALAAQQAAEADRAQSDLDAQVDLYNNDITRANASLAAIQNLQSQVYFAATPDDVNGSAQAVAAAQSAGQFITQADVTTAQQNRTTLQSALAARNQDTAQSIAACRTTGGRI